MKIFIFYITILFSILSSCHSSAKYFEKSYDDKTLSKSEEKNGIYNHIFIRHGFLYLDSLKRKKIIERKIYKDEKLIYIYPIRQSNLPKTKIWLASNNNFLLNKGDTVLFKNTKLPIMNRHIWVKGAAILQISDTSYSIKVINNSNRKAIFYISVSDYYEEANKGNGFISDSLVLEIR